MSSGPIPFPVRGAFVHHLGFELWACAAGRAQMQVTVDARHLNSWGVAHGGVVMSLMDVGMAFAARSDHLDGPGVATLEMKTSFMRPAEGRLRCEAQRLTRTATLAFCEASIFDDAGHLCAHATGTFKFLRQLPSRQGRGARPVQDDSV